MLTTYAYEALLDEQFQLMCQALLVLEYPGMQCMPIGMPDGGRDGSAPDVVSGGRMIFQVKFARAPERVEDPVKWATAAIDGELAKIKKLIERGATRYVLITNMPGTSHLDSGRIDRVQAHMDAVVPIPASTMWREDLDRRLDGNFDVKLRYPALLNGPDHIRQLWEQALDRDSGSARRSSAITAYLSSEYKRDSTVRFKQADLSPTSLLDLFIDVPAYPAGVVHGRRLAVRRFAGWRDVAARSAIGTVSADPGLNTRIITGESGMMYVASGDGTYRSLEVGAAEVLLDANFGDNSPFVALEGAPGQGKSTLSQYVCQVHRIRLLGKEVELSGLTEKLRDSAVATPFKLELRDVAAWLRGVNPWLDSGDKVHDDVTTVEACLAAHVRRFSGGIAFDVADIHAVFKRTPVLLVFDALDEVADLEDRQLVIDAIGEALERLESQAHQLKVLVTSRPTAVANAPSFPIEQFTYLALGAIPRQLAMDFSVKWSKARGLEEHERRELLEMLAAKLDQPHMAELAKNTMQLSILLSLMHLRGASLPDKRTELYDTYVDVFLNRESEKSTIVRNNRQLLVDIHRFLAFHMHAQAESGHGSGRITLDELRAEITAYLAREGHEGAAVEDLLTGMVERVVALVSRVEGTYEFEVQPLREYFAARHLYDTSPYSPPGRECSGTKPDRFDALASNPYWLNTTRFFAGCFSKGELADLGNRVCDLMQHPQLSHMAYPRSLAYSLLQDLVFTQNPQTTQQVVKVLFDPLGLRYSSTEGSLLDPDGFRRSVISLSASAGQAILAGLLHEHLAVDGNTDRALHLSHLLRVNERRADRSRWWLDRLPADGHPSRNNWIRIGGWLDVLGDVGVAACLPKKPTAANAANAEALALLAKADLLTDDLPADTTAAAVQAVLNRAAGRYSGERTRTTPLGLLDLVLATSLWRQYVAFPEEAFHAEFGSTKNIEAVKPSAVMSVVQALANSMDGGLTRDMDQWLQVDAVINSLTDGPSLAALELAVVAAGVRNPLERGRGARDLFDHAVAAPLRVRYARRQAKNVAYWRPFVESAATPHDRWLVLCAALTWADSVVVQGLLPEMDQLAHALPQQYSDALAMFMTDASTFAKSARGTLQMEGADVGHGIGRLVLHRLSPKSQSAMAARLLGEQLSPVVAGQILDVRVAQLETGQLDAPAALADIRKCHEAGGRLHHRGSSLIHFMRANPAVATAVLREPWEMPSALVEAAEAGAGRRSGRRETVLARATREGWFRD